MNRSLTVSRSEHPHRNWVRVHINIWSVDSDTNAEKSDPSDTTPISRKLLVRAEPN